MCLNLLFQQKHLVFCLTTDQGKEQAHTPPSLLVLFFLDNHRCALLLVSVPTSGSSVSASPYQMFSQIIFIRTSTLLTSCFSPAHMQLCKMPQQCVHEVAPLTKFRRNDNFQALSSQLLPWATATS